MKKRLLILILILCFALSLSSCGEKETPAESEKDQEELLNELYGDNRVEAVAAQKRDNVFTISYVPTRSMNPITGSCAENSMLEGLVYESLFVLDEHFDPQNMLCSSYSTEDGLTYRFEIVPGVKFSDGTPLTASDVMYSIDYAREFERYEYRLSNIESTTVEDGVFIVTLDEADMSLPSLLDVPVIPQGSIDSDRPIGSGLYMLAETETSARLVKNPYYRDPSKIPLDTVYLTSFSTSSLNELFDDGSLDLVWMDPCDSSSVALGGNHDERQMNTTMLQYVGFDCSNALLADKNIRNAVACSVNRTLAVREMDGFGLKAPLIFSRAWSYYDNSLEREEESDRAFTASEYLRKAGMMDFDKDGWLDFPDSSTETGYYCIVELTITVHADSREKRLVANEMASFLNGIGLKTKVNELPWDKYEEAVKSGSCDIYLAEVRVPASFDLADILSSGGRLNYGGIDSDDLDDLIDEFRSAAGEDKRSAAGQLALSVRDNAYIVPILYRQFAIHSQRNTIYGLIASPSSLFYNFSDWTFRLG